MILGGGGSNWPTGILADPPTHPPTHPHQKIFPQEKNEIYQRGPNLEVNCRYTNFFLASDPPTHPPARYSINQPLSKGLGCTVAQDCADVCQEHVGAVFRGLRFFVAVKRARHELCLVAFKTLCTFVPWDGGAVVGSAEGRQLTTAVVFSFISVRIGVGRHCTVATPELKSRRRCHRAARCTTYKCP